MDDKYAEYDYPEETVVNFDDTTYYERKEFVKDFLNKMEDKNGSITKFAKTANNFYTLWALVVLSDNLPADFADRYLNFMLGVELFASAEDPEDLVKGAVNEDMKLHYNYYKNSRGASTDLHQRSERLNSLRIACLR